VTTGTVCAMPVYEYVCRDCDTVFEARRTMAEADAPLTCPDGHEKIARRLSVFAATGRASAAPAGAPARSMGPCGPACGCHH
jgi:putative FmdB family regulatory protein